MYGDVLNDSSLDSGAAFVIQNPDSAYQFIVPRGRSRRHLIMHALPKTSPRAHYFCVRRVRKRISIGHGVTRPAEARLHMASAPLCLRDYVC